MENKKPLNFLYYLIFSFLFLGNVDTAVGQNVISENIYFLKQDGRSYLKYFTTRSDYDSYWIAVNKNRDVEKYYRYLYPPNYQIDTVKGKWYNKLRFSQGSYAAMVEDVFRTNVSYDTLTNVYTFSNDSKGSSKNRRGISNASVPFNQFVYVWVLPDNFEFIRYKSEYQTKNPDSCVKVEEDYVIDSCNWEKRGNTLTFYGNEVNNLVFNIQYRLKGQKVVDRLISQLKTVESKKNIKVKQDSTGTVISMKDYDGFLFRPGGTELRSESLEPFRELLDVIKSLNSKKIIIEGHTDNKPVVKSKYKSNMELSTARAIAIYDLFIQNGFGEIKFEVRGFGASQPVAPNDTTEGRKENRRIVIRLPNKVE